MVTADSLRIVFFGTPEFAVPSLSALLDSRHLVTAVVTQPDRPSGRGHQTSDSPVKRVAREAGIPVLQPHRLKAPDFGMSLDELRPDLGVVAAYGKILPEPVLTRPRLGLINVHASLLPRYRGAAPVHRAVIAGERTTGVTIMRVVRALDAGPMLSRRERPIGPDETSDVVEKDLAVIGAQLLLATIEDLVQGRIEEEPQDETASSYAPRLAKTDGLIDWTRTAGDIHNQVRGLHPWPHAYSFLDGQRIIILRTSRQPAQRVDRAPATVVEARGDDFRVSAGEGSVIQLVEVQVEGRRPMNARDFLAGHPIDPGQHFSRS